MRSAAALLLGVVVAGAPALTYAQHGGGGGHSGGGGGGPSGGGGGGHFAGGGHFGGAGHFGGGGHFAGAPHVMGGGYFAGAHFGASQSHYASAGPGLSAAHSFTGTHVAVHGATHYVRPGAPVVGRPGGAPAAPATGYWHGGQPWVGGYWHGAYWPHVWFYPGWAWYVPVLPIGYATFWWGGMPYYYWNNLYYTWSPADSGYIVTDPPPASGDNFAADAGAAAYDGGAYDQSGTAAPYDQPAPSQYTAPTGGGAQLFLYPRNGQTDAQIQNDRYECHGWAVNQSGYDPTRPGEGNSAGYRQAMVACLDARGYSAR